MAAEKWKSIDEYDSWLSGTLEAWTPRQRVALAASMAERWLPAYKKFTKAEDWGDARELAGSVEAVWGHLLGRPLAGREIEQRRAAVAKHTPHMDDFDDYAALAACIMVSEALRCCRSDDNAGEAMQAMVSGFHAVEPDWDMDPDEEPELWKKSAVRGELKKQLKLVELIGATASFDAETVQALRRRMVSKEFIGEVPAPEAAKPAGNTNQALFEIYRRMMESDLKTSDDSWWQDLYEPGSDQWALMHFAAWGARYSRRSQTINGSYGVLADAAGQQAVVERQLALDGARQAVPAWDLDVREMIDLSLKNSFREFGVTSLEQAHKYGPSVRALWAEALDAGKTDAEAWQHIHAWARHRPAAWEEEDQRRKKKLPYAAAELGKLLERQLSWSATGDPVHPWEAEVDGARWQVQVNDFPDDLMYALVIDGQPTGKFHDWPRSWER